jgi:DNA-binding cell septation regulator SpoVG
MPVTTAPLVTIAEIKHVNKGSLRAFVKLFVNGVVINDARIVAAEGKDPFLAMPQRSWEDREGNTKYSNIVELDKDIRDAVQAKAIQAWRAS